MALLPPPGTDPRAAAEFVDALLRESASDEHRSDFVAQASRGQDLYHGEHWTTPAVKGQLQLVLNRVQNCIVSLGAVQAADPPQLTFTPRETGDQPVHYLNTNLPESAAWVAQLQSLGVDPVGPLPVQAAQQIKQQAQAEELFRNQQLAMGLPQPPAMTPKELLVEVNDRTSAEAVQTIHDALWEQACGQFVFVENCLHKNTLGLQPTLVEWNHETRQIELTNIHALQWFPDPLKSRKGHYEIYDQPISADEAKAKWPAITKQIDERASQTLTWPGSKSYDHGTLYDQHYERAMVVVRTAWIRHQPYPMDVQEAIDAGKVERRTVQTGNLVSEPTPEGAIISRMETREGLFLAGSEQELAPPELDETGTLQAMDPAWPITHSTRQITVVAQETVDDRRCPFDVPPIAVNINLPVLYSPYGQGEPKRLEGLQLALNHVLSDIVDWQDYNAHTPEFVHEGVAAAMGPELKNCRALPGKRYIIPQNVFDLVQGDIQKLLMSLPPAAVPSDFWKLLQLLIELIDKEGNQSDVMQGNASSSWSGTTVAALQGAASQVIRGKSLYTEFYLKDLATLINHAIVHFMGPEDWAKYLGSMPVQAVQAFYDRRKRLHVDVSVEVRSGSGAGKQAEINNLVAARNAKVPVSDDTILERMKLDADAEQQKQLGRQAKGQAMMPQMATPGEPAKNAQPMGGSQPQA
jgi:hypothetical protein